MGLSQTPDMNYNPIHMEEKQDGESNFNKAINDINSKLALDGLKIELPKTQEEKETHGEIYENKDFLGALERGIFKEGITVKYINDNLFGVYSKKTGEITFFTNKKGELILNVSYRESLFIDEEGEYLKSTLKAFEQAGFFMDSKSGKRNIYKILGKDKKGELILDKIPLDKNTINYFNALKEIAKKDDTINILLILKQKWEIGEGNLNDFALSGALNLKYLLLFQEKGLFESSDLFEYGIKELKIKESDIKSALDKGEINQEQAIKIYKVLPENMKDLTSKILNNN